jgi:hypothetical protein
VIPIVVIDNGVRSDYAGPRWRDVRVGDGLSYSDGALFIVEARAIDDGKQVTLLTRCVVPPAIGDYAYGDLSMLARRNADPIPDECTIVRPTR